MLTRSREPGCVIDWSDFSQQHTVVELPILWHFPNLLDMSFSSGVITQRDHLPQTSKALPLPDWVIAM